MVWDKNTGKPVYNAIVWQDRRTAKMSDELREEWGEEITRRTGLVVDAYFSALKIKWILNNVEGAAEKAKKGELLAGTLDSWLIWKMTDGKAHVTDPSTASRTMLFNIHTGEWDKEIMERVGIPESLVPVINETTALGAAYLAALAIGDFSDLSEITNRWKLLKRYEPKMRVDQREELCRQWKRSVERAKDWIEK